MWVFSYDFLDMVSVGGSLPFLKAHHKYMLKVKSPFSSIGNPLCPQPGSLSKSLMGEFKIGLGGAPPPEFVPYALFKWFVLYFAPSIYIYIYIYLKYLPPLKLIYTIFGSYKI